MIITFVLFLSYKTLNIPMNHISGICLARLERRHLADALQIFTDLVKYCYLTPTKETLDRGGNYDKILKRFYNNCLNLHYLSPKLEMYCFCFLRPSVRLSTTSFSALNTSNYWPNFNQTSQE